MDEQAVAQRIKPLQRLLHQGGIRPKTGQDVGRDCIIIGAAASSAVRTRS
jgi:hypothetical protein